MSVISDSVEKSKFSSVIECLVLNTKMVQWWVRSLKQKRRVVDMRTRTKLCPRSKARASKAAAAPVQ